jgi:hypothetical protein
MSSIRGYDIKVSKSRLTYFFVSDGKNEILKRVDFETTGVENLFNLALGDVNLVTGQTDYESPSRNTDIERVFATIVRIIYNFTENHPGCAILIQGDKEYKTRAYRIAINNFFEELSKDFQITGITSSIESLDFRMEEFVSNRRYEGFLIKRSRI